ncbi:MAG: hypothetical protein V2B19_31775 [Pseudomonadota bacterium]
MVSETSCPICKLAHIPLDTDHCPQCDADLTCFRVLDALPEPDETVPAAAPVDMPVDAPKPPGKGAAVWRWAFTGFAAGGVVTLAILLTGWTIWRSPRVENSKGVNTALWNEDITRIESKLDVQRRDQQEAASTLLGRIETLDRKLSEIRELSTDDSPAPAGDLKTPETPPGDEPAMPQAAPDTAPAGEGVLRPAEFTTYRAKETDTLWKISEHFYGDGMYYPVLLTYNPDIAVYSVGKKDTLAILTDVNRVKMVYSEVAERVKNRLYWYYRVRPGDDAASLIQKYCPSQGESGGGSCLDPETILKPGQRVRIRLE